MPNIVKLNYTADEINEKLGKVDDVVQSTGNSETFVMSQKAVTDNINAVLSAFETEGGNNLLDPSNAENAYYTNNSGVLAKTSSARHNCTVTPIDVEGGSTLYLATNTPDYTDGAVCAIFELDESGVCIKNNSYKISTALAGVVVAHSLNANTAKIHLYVNDRYSFNDLCISSAEITEYEQYGIAKTPTVLKEEFLPNIEPTIENIAKQHFIPCDTVEKVPYFGGSEALEFSHTQKALDSIGNLYDNTARNTTDFISVADTYQVYVTITNGAKYTLGHIAYYDENKNFISMIFIGASYEFTTIDNKPNSYAFPIQDEPTATYVRLSLNNGYSSIKYTITPYITEYSMDKASINMPTLAPLTALTESGDIEKLLANNLNGRKIVFLGDSIFGNNQSSTGVVNQIAARVSGTVVNGAFGGTRMSLRSSTTTGYDKFDFPSIAQAISTGDYSAQDQALADYNLPSVYPMSLQALKDTDFSTVDIIVFNHGTNDWTSNISKESYQAAMENNVLTILQVYPHIQFFAVTPSWRCTISDGAITIDSDSQTFEMGTLPEVVNNMTEVAENILHIPVINNYNIGINKYNFANYFDDTDGTHQNAKGRELLARHIAHELF